MKKSRLILIILIVLCCLSVFTACGDKSGNENKSGKINEYLVRFITNGGSEVSDGKFDEIDISPFTERKFYTFTGWYLNDNLDESSMVEFPLKLTGDVTLYAGWEMKNSEGLQFNYSNSENGYYISGYNGSDKYVTVLSEYNDEPILGVSESAFSENNKIEEVLLSENIRTLKRRAFANCSRLIGITIPQSVISIEEACFYNCYALAEIDLPEQLEYIGSNAFNGCRLIVNLSVSDTVKSIGRNAFENCDNLKFELIDGGCYLNDWLVGTVAKEVPSDLYIKENAIGISDAAFAYNKNLQELCIPDSLIYLGNSAFEYCSNLNNVVIGDGVKIIGDYAFSNSGIVTLTLGNGVTDIGISAFKHCKIKEVIMPDKIEKIGGSAFANCVNLDYVAFSKNLKTIGGSAFSNCKLKEIVLPEYVTEIGKFAFYNNQSLTRAIISENVNFMGDSAFVFCPSLSVFCKSGAQPDNWSNNWNYNRPVYWYRDSEPIPQGNYWHYVDGNIAVW